MTGEMCKADVTREAFPLHFAVARAIKGTVHPFDVYQGPYVLTQKGHRLFLCSDDGTWARWWNEATRQESQIFWLYDWVKRYCCAAAGEVI